MKIRYSPNQIMEEMIRRVTIEALEFIIELGEEGSWEDFSKEWKKRNPNKSYFLSGYIGTENENKRLKCIKD